MLRKASVSIRRGSMLEKSRRFIPHWEPRKHLWRRCTLFKRYKLLHSSMKRISVARVRLATIVMFKLELDFRLIKLKHAKSANGGKVTYLQKTSPVGYCLWIIQCNLWAWGCLVCSPSSYVPLVSFCAVKLMDYQCTREIIWLLHYMQLLIRHSRIRARVREPVVCGAF